MTFVTDWRVHETLERMQTPAFSRASRGVTGAAERPIHQIGFDPKQAAGGSLADVVKLNLFLTDLAHFAKVNEIMALYFSEPYPARAAVGVASLPRSAGFEAEAVMVLPAR